MSETAKRAAIYIRVSTDEQAEDGFSIDAQKRKLLLYAQSQDWAVNYIYIDDGYSAKDLNRPEMKNLLKAADNQEFDIVLTYKLDRLTRSVSDCDKLFQVFDKLDISYQSATESFETRTATGRMFIRLVAVMAQWERENTAERVRFGIEQKTLQGEKIGLFPYGYTNKGDLIKDEAVLIEEVRSKFMQGAGRKTIAMAMNGAGKLRRGSLWTDATVGYTIENPLYYGLTRIGTKTKDGVYINWRKDERLECVYGDSIYQAIFTKEQYEETKKELKRRRKGNGYSRINTYWFSGVLKCGRCGAAMFGRINKDSRYYICSSRQHQKSCDMPVVRQKHLEMMLLEYLKNMVFDNELIKDKISSVNNQQEDVNARIERLNQQILTVRNRRKKWQYMFANDLISPEELKERLQEENDLIRDYETKISNLESSPAVSNIRDIETAKSFLALWPEMNDEEKKEFIASMFDKIVFNTNTINPRVGKGKFYPAWLEGILFN
jgi:site-specific DNA recombinase